MHNSSQIHAVRFIIFSILYGTGQRRISAHRPLPGLNQRPHRRPQRQVLAACRLTLSYTYGLLPAAWQPTRREKIDIPRRMGRFGLIAPRSTPAMRQGRRRRLMTDSSLGEPFPIDHQRILRRDRRCGPSLIARPGEIRETFPEMPGVFPLPGKPVRAREFAPNQGIAANTRAQGLRTPDHSQRETRDDRRTVPN